MRRDDQRQAVKNIPLEQLKPFKNHPFQVRDDEEFRRLVESIEIHGVIHPAVARQIGEDCYELISGHRRKAACEVLGYSEMPVLVRSMTDDEAVVNMVDANLQRETILPSERAFAYKMKLVAMSHQGRKGFTSAQLGRKCVGRARYDMICKGLIQYQEEFPFYFKMVLDKINVDFKDHDYLPEEKATYHVGEEINEKMKEFLVAGIQNGDLREDLKIMPTIFQFWGMLAGLIQLAANKEEYIKMSMDLSKSEFLEDGFGMLYHSIENIQ